MIFAVFDVLLGVNMCINYGFYIYLCGHYICGHYIHYIAHIMYEVIKSKFNGYIHVWMSDLHCRSYRRYIHRYEYVEHDRLLFN